MNRIEEELRRIGADEGPAGMMATVRGNLVRIWDDQEEGVYNMDEALAALARVHDGEGINAAWAALVEFAKELPEEDEF